mgnify:CR=1 FL=1
MSDANLRESVQRITVKQLCRRFLQKYFSLPHTLSQLNEKLAILQNELDEQKLLTAKLLIERIRSHEAYPNIHDAEFKVYSQNGEDGIIQYLIHLSKIDSGTFIEFGVENYREANTRFLLVNNNWSGLVIDCDESNIEQIKHDHIYWKYNLKAVHSFLSCDNINQVFLDNGYSGEIGLLSIDVDGNDYWLWKESNVISPIIVVVEYNSIFGKDFAVTIPYQPAFQRFKAHHSGLYWGCSLKALHLIAEQKGYVFVGSNSSGNNAFFVRHDKLGNIKPVNLNDGYVESKYRESRDTDGRLTYLSGRDRIDLIKEMTVYDVQCNRYVKIKDLYICQ